MSENRSLPPADQTRSSMFGIFRGGNDRYSQFEDDTILASSPSAIHDFPEPMKLKPRKSRFDVESESSNSRQMQTLDKPKIILATTSGKTTRLSSEVFQQQLTSRFQTRQLDNGSPHGSLEVSPSAAASVTMFEKAHQITTNKQQLNMPLSQLVRRASDTNLFRSMAVPVKGDNTVVQASQNTVAMTEKTVDKPPLGHQVEEINVKIPKDTVDGNKQTVGGTFGGWLFGGETTMKVQNKDINVLSPTSF